MTLLKLVDDELGPIGSFNWFATHGTSMSNTNSLISGDNKGAAARFMEDWAKQKGFPSGINNIYPNDFGADNIQNGLPRRVSAIISPLHENRQFSYPFYSSFIL